MLVVNRTGPLNCRLARVADLPQYLHPGDCLVINDTRVIPARFAARRTTGGRVDGVYLQSQASGEWLVMLRPSGRLKVGEALELIGGDAHLHLVASHGGGLWEGRIEPDQPATALLERIGRTPLPPYIKRPPTGDQARQLDQMDRQRYQTVYARVPGAVAAPTAGMHLTEASLAELASAGIKVAPVTLHVGLGTFEPIRAQRLEHHRMHAEWYELTPASAQTISAARAAGGRIVAVGTTASRVLETCANADGQLEPGQGMTDIFIYPPYRFRAVDALLTNFHLPGSTLLAMVFAFAGRERILAVYQRAIKQNLRFYSYGDAMLII